jgi:tape measure domain-containing protein
MNVVEYAIKIRDFATSPMAKFANSTRQATTTVNTIKTRFQDFTQKATLFTDRLTGRNKMLSMSYNELQTAIKRVENVAATSKVPSVIAAARKELEALNRQSNKIKGIGVSAPSKGGGTSGGGIMGMLGGAKGLLGAAGLALGAGALISSGTGLVSDSINKSLERQQVQTSFNVLTGNKDTGEKLTADLVKLQKDTILGSEVFSNAQTMMGYGIKAEDILPNMKMLGDVSMGDSQKLGSLTLAFSQVQAAGKLTGQDLLQFVNAGFNPLQSMSEKTGKSIGELRKEVEDGNISFADVKQAFIDATSEGGRFANMMEKIAETPAGKVRQLQGAWDEVKIKAGTAFMPAISMALDLANRILPLIESAIDSLASRVLVVAGWMSNIKNITGGFMDYVKIVGDCYRNYVIPLVVKLYNVLSDMVSKIVDFVKNSELLKDVFYFIGELCGFILDGISAMVDALKWLFDNVVMPILNAIEKGYRMIKGAVLEKDNVPDDGIDLRNFGAPLLTTLLTDPKKEKNEVTSTLKDIAKNTSSNSDKSKKTKDDIISGKQQVVNIHVGKFLDSINLNSVNIQEGAAEIEKIFMELFARVLAGTTNDALS